MQGKDIDTAIDMGQWLASLSVRELGPSYVVFSSPLLIHLTLFLKLEIKSKEECVV